MHALLLAASLLLGDIHERDGGLVDVVTRDGGQVPTVAPKLTDNLAPVLAPELVPDGGGAADGGMPTLVAPAVLSVYKVDLPVEATVTAGAAILYATMDFLIKPSLEGDISCRQPVGNGRCNPASLNGFDRYAVGRDSAPWRTFSDIALGASLVLPIIYLGLESIALPTQHPVLDWLNDLLIVAESMAVTGALNTVLKFAVRRPRPIRYANLTEPVTEFDAELSFPSGHTSMVAAATTAMTMTVFLRHPRSKVRYVVLGAGALLTALTGLARVESGSHFPTDVIVGALVGGFAGFAVPYFHRRLPALAPVVALDLAHGGATFGAAGQF
ncbi:MAG: phosphatase PAP2 family protein [Archangiaceae bacterium]|nr:phosphatase PAP2 family protein [Archangiaceae bacterium]